MIDYYSPSKAGDELRIQQTYVDRGDFSKENVNEINHKSGIDEQNKIDMNLANCEAKEEAWCMIDLGGSYPIGKMYLWTLNQDHTIELDLTSKGIKLTKIEYSLDQHHWVELDEDCYPYYLSQVEYNDQNTNFLHRENTSFKFKDVLARYIKFSVQLTGQNDVQNDILDLIEIRIYAGKGLAVEPASDWTDLFHRKVDWSGADGIYSIPFNGCEKQGEARSTKTIFIFGDTFIGEVDPATNRRINPIMLNNSVAILEGDIPKENRIKFLWNEDEEGNPLSYLVPASDKGKSIAESYYWLQDGISIAGTFYCFPMIISPDPTQPEGFEFKVNGVTCVSAPIGEEGPKLEEQIQLDTPFYYVAENGKITYFGAGFMANTQEAHVPDPDGFIYVYGLQKWDTTKLVVARILPSLFTEFDKWEFWDGAQWSAEKEKAVPIADEVSSELSVSPMSGGFLDGKYIVVFQEHGTGHRLGIYIGDSPVGPFEKPKFLYYCSESEKGNGIYTYNAKGHPHLSNPGELLVSYNVNTSSWAMHEKDGSIYRPKFLTIKQFE